MAVGASDPPQLAFGGVESALQAAGTHGGLDVRCDQVSKGDHEYFDMVPVL